MNLPRCLLFSLVAFGAVTLPLSAQDEPKAPEENGAATEEGANPIGDGEPTETLPANEPFTAVITYDGESETYTDLRKASSLLRKAKSKVSRLDDDEPTGFEAVVTINGSQFTYDQPADVQALSKALSQLTGVLKRAKMTLADLGSFENLPPAPDPNAPPQLSPQQVQALITQQVAMQAQQQYRRTGRRMSQQQMQQMYEQGVKKAREQGMLPPEGTPPPDPKEVQLQNLRNVLIPALRKGTPTGGAPAAAAGEGAPNAEQE